MFEGLSQKLLSIFGNIRNKGVLTEDVIDSTIREIRISLLEADVALSVVKQFSSDLKEKLKDQKVIKSVTPEQTIIKIVYDELVKLLGTCDESHKYKSVMLVGLQGSGKTTTAAKLANLFKTKFKSKCLLVPLDTYRPAAITQLEKLANDNNIDFFSNFNQNDKPIDIASKAQSIVDNYDTVIYDTAGRLYIDEKLMKELVELKFIINPKDILLVIDSMMGQDAINTTKTFNEYLNINGLI